MSHHMHPTLEEPQELAWDSTFDFDPPSFEDETTYSYLYSDLEDETLTLTPSATSSFHSGPGLDEIDTLTNGSNEEVHTIPHEPNDDNKDVESEEEDDDPEESWWYSDAKAPESKYDEWYLSYLHTMKVEQTKSTRRYGGLFNPSCNAGSASAVAVTNSAYSMESVDKATSTLDLNPERCGDDEDNVEFYSPYEVTDPQSASSDSPVMWDSNDEDEDTRLNLTDCNVATESDNEFYEVPVQEENEGAMVNFANEMSSPELNYTSETSSSPATGVNPPPASRTRPKTSSCAEFHLPPAPTLKFTDAIFQSISLPAVWPTVVVDESSVNDTSNNNNMRRRSSADLLVEEISNLPNNCSQSEYYDLPWVSSRSRGSFSDNEESQCNSADEDEYATPTTSPPAPRIESSSYPVVVLHSRPAAAGTNENYQDPFFGGITSTIDIQMNCDAQKEMSSAMDMNLKMLKKVVVQTHKTGRKFVQIKPYSIPELDFKTKPSTLKNLKLNQQGTEIKDHQSLALAIAIETQTSETSSSESTSSKSKPSVLTPLKEELDPVTTPSASSTDLQNQVADTVPHKSRTRSIPGRKPYGFNSTPENAITFIEVNTSQLSPRSASDTITRPSKIPVVSPRKLSELLHAQNAKVESNQVHVPRLTTKPPLPPRARKTAFYGKSKVPKPR